MRLGSARGAIGRTRHQRCGSMKSASRLVPRPLVRLRANRRQAPANELGHYGSPGRRPSTPRPHLVPCRQPRERIRPGQAARIAAGALIHIWPAVISPRWPLHLSPAQAGVFSCSPLAGQREATPGMLDWRQRMQAAGLRQRTIAHPRLAASEMFAERAERRNQNAAAASRPTCRPFQP